MRKSSVKFFEVTLGEHITWNDLHIIEKRLLKRLVFYMEQDESLHNESLQVLRLFISHIAIPT